MYLGLDYGRTHIGVALSERDLATPLATIANSSLPEVIAQLRAYIKNYHVDQLICGLPEGELSTEIKLFAQNLETELGLKVTLHPETLSTQEALIKLHAAGASRKKLQNDHAYAAILILEDYLDQQNSVN